MCAFCRNLLSRCFSCHRQEKNPTNVIFWVWARVKGRVFPGGQWDHFLAIIRKNILRAVFPGRGLMARWHNGRGGVLSSSRSGGRGACGRRQPTIMDSPSFHSLSFLVDVFVFVIVFVLLFFYDDGQHIGFSKLPLTHLPGPRLHLCICNCKRLRGLLLDHSAVYFHSIQKLPHTQENNCWLRWLVQQVFFCHCTGSCCNCICNVCLAFYDHDHIIYSPCFAFLTS